MTFAVLAGKGLYFALSGLDPPLMNRTKLINSSGQVLGSLGEEGSNLWRPRRVERRGSLNREFASGELESLSLYVYVLSSRISPKLTREDVADPQGIRSRKTLRKRLLLNRLRIGTGWSRSPNSAILSQHKSNAIDWSVSVLSRVPQC